MAEFGRSPPDPTPRNVTLATPIRGVTSVGFFPSIPSIDDPTPNWFVPVDKWYELYPEKGFDPLVVPPPDGNDVFNPDVDWREDLDTEASSDAYFDGQGNSHASIRGEVEANKLRSLVLYTVGYATAGNPAVDGTGNPNSYKLLRHNPPTHPRFPWLRAKGLTIQLFAPEAGTPPTDPSLTRPGDVPAGHPFKEYSMRPRDTGENFGGGTRFGEPDRLYRPFSIFTTRYTKAKVSIDFAQNRVQLLENEAIYGSEDDGIVGSFDESQRNTYWTTEPSVDLLALEGGEQSKLYWRQGSTTGPTVATNIPTTTPSLVDPQTSGFPAPTGYLTPKVMDVCHWHQVPTRYFLDENLVPDKILSCLGKVNKSAWLGYPPNTALLLGFSMEPIPWPVYFTSSPGYSGTNRQGVIELWNIKFMFKFYNAPVNVDATPSSTKRGYNLYQWQDGRTYVATRFNGDGLYQEAEFGNILFAHREAL